ncbi:unnamed protein product [Mytilus coruscus]|uniref:Uncharacterized protein n=1 Tax=Mytilus coruscus TaxID=42192 RepID=A0A6J8B041_MYTCO|nr:unnamed protein product [Mytilus coruscus]
MDAFGKATQLKPYSYLCLDLSQRSNKQYSLRTRIFPDEDTIVYRPRDEENIIFIKFLITSTVSQRDILFWTVTDAQLQLLNEIIFNLPQGIIPISRRIKERLHVNNNKLRRVVQVSVARRVRKKRLIGISGDLPTVLRAFLNSEQRTDSRTKAKI